MAEIKEYPKDHIKVVQFYEDEMVKLREIAMAQDFSLNEVIIACFQIGIIQLVAKTMRDKDPI